MNIKEDPKYTYLMLRGPSPQLLSPLGKLLTFKSGGGRSDCLGRLVWGWRSTGLALALAVSAPVPVTIFFSFTFPVALLVLLSLSLSAPASASITVALPASFVAAAATIPAPVLNIKESEREGNISIDNDTCPALCLYLYLCREMLISSGGGARVIGCGCGRAYFEKEIRRGACKLRACWAVTTHCMKSQELGA